MRLFLTFFFWSVLFTSLFSQNHYQGHYFNSPMVVNPAYTGVMNEQYKIGIDFRSQWFNPINSNDFRSYLAHAEMKSHVNKDDYYGLGLNINNESSGISDFNQTGIFGSFAYLKSLNRSRTSDTYINGGISFGAMSFKYNSDNFWFGNQFDISTLAVNKNIASQEGNQIFRGNQSGFIPLLGTGISIFHTTKNFSIYGGLGIDHLNRPNYNLGGNVDLMPFKFSTNIGGSYYLTSSSQLLPAVLWVKQGPHGYTSPSIQYRFTNLDDDEIAFRIGFIGRFTKGFQRDNFGLITMLEYHKIVFGFSYEFTNSSLQAYNNNNGGFELSMHFRFADVVKKESINCPKF